MHDKGSCYSVKVIIPTQETYITEKFNPKVNCEKMLHFLIVCLLQDLICSPSDILEPRKQGSVRVAISVSELLRFHHLRTT